MSLDPLATVEDVEARLGRTLIGTEEDQMEALLADVSAAVRAYTGQEITAGTSSDIRLKVQGTTVRLPQRPVTAVDGVDSVTGDTLGFTWYAGDHLELDSVPTVGWVDVTYDHGYDDVPPDLIAVVCNIAMRAFGTPAEQTGLQSESIGTYSYTVGGAAAAGALGLLADEKKILDNYRRTIGSAWVAW
jgi:hypothetical protein